MAVTLWSCGRYQRFQLTFTLDFRHGTPLSFSRSITTACLVTCPVTTVRESKAHEIRRTPQQYWSTHKERYAAS
jgi:hypothetical protein